MITLTKASIVSRKGIRYGIYGIIAVLIIRQLLSWGLAAYRHYFPPPPPKPTVVFGSLPELPFPKSNVDENLELKYSVDTVEGVLPPVQNQARIYFMPKATSTINALDKAKGKAIKLGFTGDGKELVETVYEFTDQSQFARLSMNIVSGIFSISYDFDSDPQVFINKPPNFSTSESAAVAFLYAADILPEDVEEGPKTAQYLKLEGGKLIPVLSLSEADATKANLFRIDYEEIPSVTPEFDEANIWFIFTNSNKTRNVFAGEYHYYPIDIETSGTYPIKSSEEAYEDLKNGDGYIVKLGNNHNGEIKINQVYLGYYDAGQYVEFYQPVFVFEGQRGFVAYVPAITSDLYGNQESEE